MAPNTKDMRRPDLSEFAVSAVPLLLSPRFPQHWHWRSILLVRSVACAPCPCPLRFEKELQLIYVCVCVLLLVVPYQEPSVKGEVTDFSSTLSSTLPMAAMFMRNKFIGWYEIYPTMHAYIHTYIHVHVMED